MIWVAHRVDGCQRGKRVLEHHGDVTAAVLAHGFVAEAQQLFAFEAHGTGDVRGFGQEPHDGHGRDGLTGTGFAHDAQGFARHEVEIHSANRVDYAVLGIEADVEVADAQDGVAGGVEPCVAEALSGCLGSVGAHLAAFAVLVLARPMELELGSKASRRPSFIMASDPVSRNMTVSGTQNIQGNEDT